MPIGNVVQRGTSIQIYNERGQLTASIGCSSSDALKGYTSHQVNIQRGSSIQSYDERGRLISSVAAPPPPRQQPAPRQSSQPSSSGSGSSSSGGGSGAALLLFGALAFGAYHYIWPSKKQPISAENASMAVTNADSSAGENVPPPNEDVPSASDQSSSRRYAKMSDVDGRDSESDRPSESSEPASTNRPASMSWADASQDVDLDSDRIHSAVAKALTTGTAVMWKSNSHKGYAVPSDLQTGTQNQCRNLYETVFANDAQVSGPSATYCYDQDTDSWSKK